MNTLPPGGGPHNPQVAPDAVLPPPALGETWAPGTPATAQSVPGGTVAQPGPGGASSRPDTARRARRRHTFWTVLLVLALVAGSVITWFATSPSRERARLAAQVATDINGVLAGDEQASHRLVDSTGAQELEGEVISLLNREGAEAALGAPVTVSVDASKVKLGKTDTVVTATVKGSRTSTRLEVVLKRELGKQDWTVQPLDFPVVTVAPAGPGRPSSLGFNGLTLRFPARESAANLQTWPGDSSKLSLGGDEFVSWGETDLGRIPARSFSGGNELVRLTWSPRPAVSQAALDAARKASEEWLAQRVAERAQETVAHPPINATLDFAYAVPVDRSVDGSDTVRNVQGKVIAPPSISVTKSRGTAAQATPTRGPAARGPLAGDPPTLRLEHARLEFTGEYLLDGKWRPFTLYVTVSAEVELGADFATVTRGDFL